MEWRSLYTTINCQGRPTNQSELLLRTFDGLIIYLNFYLSNFSVSHLLSVWYRIMFLRGFWKPSTTHRHTLSTRGFWNNKTNLRQACCINVVNLPLLTYLTDFKMSPKLVLVKPTPQTSRNLLGIHRTSKKILWANELSVSF